MKKMVIVLVLFMLLFGFVTITIGCIGEAPKTTPPPTTTLAPTKTAPPVLGCG